MSRCLLLFIIYFFYSMASAQTDVSFVYSFENGLNLADRPERLSAGSATGNSYNFDFMRDGTARSRKGRELDYAAVSIDTSVNLLGRLKAATNYYPLSRGLAIIGNKMFVRNNNTGTYSELTVPAGISTSGTDMLQSVEFDGNLIIAGDISAMCIFDGDSIARLATPTFANSSDGSASLVTGGGGSLADSTTYTYAATYKTRQGYESYRGALITAPMTYGSYLATTISGYPRYPADYTNSSDTTNIVARLWYRSTNGGSSGGFLASQPVSATTFVDSGQYNLDATVNFPTYRSSEKKGFSPVVSSSQLWFAINGEEHLSQYSVATLLASDGLTIDVSPAATATTESGIGKISFNTGYKYTALSDGRYEIDFTTNDYGINRTKWREVPPSSESKVLVGDANQDGSVTQDDYTLVLAEAATPGTLTGDSLNAADIEGDGDVDVSDVQFMSSWLNDTDKNPLARGVVPGDYVTWVSNSVAGAYSAKVLGVPEEKKIIVDGPITTAAVPKYVGRNIIRINDEYIAIGNISGGNLLVAKSSDSNGRGIFSSTAASHAVGTDIYYGGDQSNPGQSVIRSLTFNPIKHQTQDPIDIADSKITGLFKGEGFVGVCTQDAVYQIVGDDIPYLYSLSKSVGNISLSSIVPYEKGAFMLDSYGVRYVSGDGVTDLSSSLGKAISDSTYAGYYQYASAAYYNNKVYISTVTDANLGCDVWVGDLGSSTSGLPIWTRYTGWSAKSWQTWNNSNGVPELYLGGWDGGSIYKVSETNDYDEDSTGTSSDITAQVITPAYSVQGSFTDWKYAILNIDTRDSVRVDALISTRVGAAGGSQNSYEKNLLVLSPSNGDTTTSGSMMSYRMVIGASGFTCKLRIWKKGSSGTTIFPGAIYGSAREL